MQRVLIVVANREQFPEPAFPVGALYVAAAVEAAGGRARVFDAGLYRRPLAALRAELETWRPDAVGLSLRNADNAAWPYTRTYAGWYARVADTVRAAAPQARIVLGGPAFSIFPREIRRALRVRRRCRRRRRGGRAAARRGPSSGGHRRALPLDDPGGVSLPADLAGVFPGAGRYRTAGVQTARGCTHRCVYCTYPRLEGTRLRRRPPEAVADEMERLRRDLGTTEQFVVDSSFNAEEGHMIAVCEELLRRRGGPGAPLADVSFSCYLQPRVSDPDVFRLLRAAGCTSVDFGIDTAAEEVLPGFGKSFTIADLRASTAAAKAAGLDVCHSLLFGGPGETPATVAETVRVTDEVAPTAVVAMVGLRIYPETDARAARPRRRPHRRAPAAARAAVLRRRRARRGPADGVAASAGPAKRRRRAGAGSSPARETGAPPGGRGCCGASARRGRCGATSRGPAGTATSEGAGRR